MTKLEKKDDFTGDVEMQRLQNQISVFDDKQREIWSKLFNKIDTDGNGRISYKELKSYLKRPGNRINKFSMKRRSVKVTNAMIREICEQADINGDNEIDLNEFLSLVERNKEIRGLLRSAFDTYMKHLIPPSKRDVPDYMYEDEYSCRPPRLGLIIISLLEIIAFVYNAVVQTDPTGLSFSELTTALIYDPHRRYEAWRFLTYMFVHNGILHLFVNLLVQILLGVPLEMVHNWWRVILIYLAGVVAGSLGTSISDPNVYLAGASGGVYAIMTAHVATVVMNWSEMSWPGAQLFVFLVIAVVDVGTAIYNRYTNNLEAKTIGYAAHLAGAIAGFLVGIQILRNLSEKDWERKLWWAALVIFTCLILVAVIWNIAFPSYFPTPS